MKHLLKDQIVNILKKKIEEELKKKKKKKEPITRTGYIHVFRNMCGMCVCVCVLTTNEK